MKVISFRHYTLKLSLFVYGIIILWFEFILHTEKILHCSFFQRVSQSIFTLSTSSFQTQFFKSKFNNVKPFCSTKLSNTLCSFEKLKKRNIIDIWKLNTSNGNYMRVWVHYVFLKTIRTRNFIFNHKFWTYYY